VSLYKQKRSPYWYVSFTDQDGRRIRKCLGTEDRAAAEEMERALRTDVARRKFVGFDEEAPSLLEVMAEYTLWADENHRSGDRARQCAKNVLKHISPDLAASRLTPEAVEWFQRERAREGAKPGTVHREQTVLIAALNHAVRNQVLASNPLAGRVRQVKTRPRIRLLTDSERERLVEACRLGPPHLLVAVRLMLTTGLRKQECLGLRWKDIDLDKRMLIVREGKGGKSRMVPLANQTLEMLRTLPRVGEYVVSGPDGKRIGNIKRSFGTACRQAGIENLWIHDLRRAFGSELAMRGVSPWVIQHLLGHAELRTTEVYVNISNTALRSAVDRLPELESGAITSEANCHSAVIQKKESAL